MNFFGFVLCFTTFMLSFGYSWYLYSIRESNLWWSNINDIEKLISFRTEQGLYYSFYQEFIQESNFFNGLYRLLKNNITEYPNTVNIINRMNIWQEIFIGCLYKIFKNIKFTNTNSINFYVNYVLFLQGILIGSIFILSYLINKSILGGLLSIGLFGLNRHLMSRVAYMVPLRENFALPFWWLHLLSFHLLIQPKRPNMTVQKLICLSFYSSTFLFCVQWQFSQFVILIECCVIFMLQMLDFITPSMVRFYYWTCLLSLLATCALQLGNIILLTSFTVSVLVSSLILGSFKVPDVMQSSFSGRLTWISLQCTGLLILSIVLRLLLVWIFQQNDDAHIFQFLAAKLGVRSTRNFDVNLYNCHEGFNWLKIDKLTESLRMVLYPYIIVYACLALAFTLAAFQVLWHDTEEEEELHPSIHMSVVGADGDLCSGCGHILSDHPELVYHFALSTGMALLTLIVSRMQYLLTPYITIFASMFYADSNLYEKLSRIIATFVYLLYDSENSPSSFSFSNDENKNKAAYQRISKITRIIELSRQGIVLAVLCKVVFETIVDVRTELSDLREFYDPDTVDLIRWIRSETNEKDSFAGSMQLMAAVKVVGERPIVNHPHYEDASLRFRTKRIYQIYARQSPEYVMEILKYYHVSHIIVEDSICLAKSSGCQLKDVIDLANGHMPESGYYSDFELQHVNTPRFCDSIRFLNSGNNNSFGTFFQERFVNPTFRVYRVL